MKQLSFASLPEDRLTDREKEVLSFLIKGRSSKGIAQALSISPRTVDNHIRNMMDKLGCHSRESIRAYMDKNSSCYAEKEKGWLSLRSPLPKQAFEALLAIKGRKWGLPLLLGSLLVGGSVGIWLNDRPSSPTQAHFEKPSLGSPPVHHLLKRASLLKQIGDAFNTPSSLKVVALIGPAGSGKSTLARAYAQEVAYNLVSELNATNHPTLLNSVMDFLEGEVTTEKDKERLDALRKHASFPATLKKIVLLLHETLQSQQNWLLIFDNVENPADIITYLPQPSLGSRGHVLLTTTNAHLKNCAFIDQTLSIDRLEEKEKHQLFNLIFYSHATPVLTSLQQERISAFLRHLPPYPLDISTAAYYLKTTDITFEKYLEALQHSPEELAHTQGKILEDTSPYTKTRYSIIKLSLKKIIEAHPSFYELMLFISLGDSQKISQEWLERYQKGSLTDEFIYHLKKYSLVATESLRQSQPFLSIHRTTQALSLHYLLRERSRSTAEKAFKNILCFLEKGLDAHMTHEDFRSMCTFLAHYEAFLRHATIYAKPTSFAIQGLLGCLYYYLRDFARAQAYLETALKALERHSPGNPLIPKISLYLGNLCREKGDFKKAQAALETSLKIYEKSSQHRYEWGRTLGYLGTLYETFGHYDKAKAFLLKSLAVCGQHFKNEVAHGWALTHLGHLYRSLEDYTQARTLIEKGLEIYEKKGENYIGAAWAMSYLGDIHRALGNFPLAQSYLNKSLAMYEKQFEKTHVYRANVLSYLGLLARDQGNHPQAIQRLQEALKLYEKGYGPAHLKVGRTLCALGTVYLAMNEIAQAEKLLLQSVQLLEKQPYPEVYLSFEALADVYEKKLSQAPESPFTPEWARKRACFLKQSLAIVRRAFPSSFLARKRLQEKLSSPSRPR